MADSPTLPVAADFSLRDYHLEGGDADGEIRVTVTNARTGAKLLDLALGDPGLIALVRRPLSGTLDVNLVQLAPGGHVTDVARDDHARASKLTVWQSDALGVAR